MAKEPPLRRPDALPAGVVLLPILPPTLDQEGKPVGEVQVLFAQAMDGTVVAEAYTSPQRLVTARGNLQPWVAVERQALAELLDRQNVSKLVVDAGGSDGYEMDRDGTCTSLPAPRFGPESGWQRKPEREGGPRWRRRRPCGSLLTSCAARPASSTAPDRTSAACRRAASTRCSRTRPPRPATTACPARCCRAPATTATLPRRSAG